MIVRFSDSEEFVDELQREPEAVARSIVRVSKLGRPSSMMTTYVSVVATAKVVSGSSYDIVRLEIPCGELYGSVEPHDRRVQQRAEDVIRLLEASLEETPFLVCAGVYEPAEGVAA